MKSHYKNTAIQKKKKKNPPYYLQHLSTSSKGTGVREFHYHSKRDSLASYTDSLTKTQDSRVLIPGHNKVAMWLKDSHLTSLLS